MTVQAHAATSQANSVPPVSFLWLEITGRFGLQCAHCYAASGPAGTHGIMTAADWRSVISQAAVGGVSMVQLIGGEPTQHPAFADLLPSPPAVAAMPEPVPTSRKRSAGASRCAPGSSASALASEWTRRAPTCKLWE